MKLDKTNNKVLIYCIIIGTIASFFINKGLDLAIMGAILYSIHKYSNIEKLAENTEFINKEKYIEGLNKAIKFIYIYIIIKMIVTLTTQIGGFNGLELMLVGNFVLLYNEKLQRKYVKSVNGIEIEKKRKLLNNKILTSIILAVFLGFTYTYGKNIEFRDEYINAPNYKYELTHNQDNKRIVKLSVDGFELVATENEENKQHFERYIKDSKLLLITDILEDYSKIAMVFMFILAFSQMNFKEKNKKVNTVFVNIFLTGALVFGAITFNTYSIDLEHKVISDFSEHRLYELNSKGD